MKVVLDANVLFPTVLREVLIGLAATGAYQPLWSERILEEWARATRKLGEGAEPVARAEIALLRAGWPDACVRPDAAVEDSLHLPDPDDRHVLATAISGGAAELLTRNQGDFPTRVLARHGVIRREPDTFLLEHRDRLEPVLQDVQARTEAASGRSQPLVPLLKRAGLPRLAKTYRHA